MQPMTSESVIVSNFPTDFWGAVKLIIPYIEPAALQILAQKQLSLKDMGLYLDWDGSIAFKKEDDYDHAALEPWQYENIRSLAPKVRRVTVITASGEKRILRFLGEHTRPGHAEDFWPNTTFASCFGYVVHESDKPRPRDEAQNPLYEYIPVPGYSRYEQDTATAAAHTFASTMAARFSSIPQITVTPDLRESIVGTVVYEIPIAPTELQAFLAEYPDKAAKDFSSDVHQEFLREAQIACKEAENKYGLTPRKGLKLAKLHRVIIRNGQHFIQGYIDAGIAAADKGVPAKILFDRYSSGIQTPCAWAVIDSGSDIPMAQSLAEKVPSKNRVIICIGDALRGVNQIYRQNSGEDLIDVFLEPQPGINAVSQGHALLATVAAALERRPTNPSATPQQLLRLVNGC